MENKNVFYSSNIFLSFHLNGPKNERGMRNFLYKNRCIDLFLQITNKSWITPLIPQKISTYKLIVINCCIQLLHQIPPPLIRDGKNCLCPNIYIYMNFFHPKVRGQVLFPLSCHALPCSRTVAFSSCVCFLLSWRGLSNHSSILPHPIAIVIPPPSLEKIKIKIKY